MDFFMMFLPPRLKQLFQYLFFINLGSQVEQIYGWKFKTSQKATIQLETRFREVASTYLASEHTSNPEAQWKQLQRIAKKLATATTSQW